MSFITRNVFGASTTNNLQSVTDKLNGLEQANVQLGEYLKLKVHQFEEIQTKLKELESDTRINKLADDIKLLQDTSLNNKTVDLIINTKVDAVNKNVKTFSDLIETKILNKITKIEESLKEKFEEVDRLNTLVTTYKNETKNFTSQESLEEIVKELNKRIDQLNISELNNITGTVSSLNTKVQKIENNLSTYSEDTINFLNSRVVELSTNNLHLSNRIDDLESRLNETTQNSENRIKVFEESDTNNVVETNKKVEVEKKHEVILGPSKKNKKR